MSAKSGKVVLSVLIVLSFLLSPASRAAAQGSEIILDPTPVEVVSGDSFTVTLKINNVPPPGMAAYDFKITFTPGVISIDSVEIVQPDFGDPMALNINNGAGFVTFNDILAAVEGPSGDITLANINGTAVSTESATTALHFDKADVMDPDGEPISATATDGEVRVWVAPVANFTWNYTDANGSGTLDAGEAIQFTDTSTNSPASWNWDFDDTTSSTDQNPTHSYDTADTYSVSLSVTNPAGSGGTSDNVTVEPNSLATVTVSPDTTTVLAGGSATFTASGYDEFSNSIFGIAWGWELTDLTAGTIDPATGEFTAGDTPGTYADVIKATGTYKAATASGNATVEIVSLLADIGMSKGLGGDGIALVGARIDDTYDPSTGETVAVPGGLGGYAAVANYTGSQINILDILAGDAPFDAAPTASIDNSAGHTSFDAVQTAAEPQAPITVAQMVVRLVGSTMEEAELELSFSEITDGGGALIPQDAPASEFFRRGDARVDGEVNISDALFIAQYLVELRDLGQGIGFVHPINAASIKHDDSGDEISISDVLFICQYLANLRGSHFELTE